MKKKPYIHPKEIHDLNSAKKMVECLYQIFQPKSVIDIGCGVGNFLYVFKKLGVEKVLGLDGDWVSKEQLADFLKDGEFISADLKNDLKIDQKFDLALSLEVAEHLPERNAVQFVKNICQTSDVIVFSAAYPYQGGQNHLNEQWPEYWADKFKNEGFLRYDLIRPIIWNDPDILVWYKQNTFVFARSSKNLELETPLFKPNMRFVHPDLYHYKAKQLELIQSGRYNLNGYLRIFAKAILRFLKLYNK